MQCLRSRTLFYAPHSQPRALRHTTAPRRRLVASIFSGQNVRSRPLEAPPFQDSAPAALCPERADALPSAICSPP